MPDAEKVQTNTPRKKTLASPENAAKPPGDDAGEAETDETAPQAITAPTDHKNAADKAAVGRLSESPFAAATSAVDASTSVGVQSQAAAAGGVSVHSATAIAGAGGTATAAQAQSAEIAKQAVPLSGVAVEIAAQGKSGRRSFDIRLDPAELGRIHVRLDVDRDGTVISRLIVDRADTLDLLRRDAPQLERALQDAGLKVDQQSMQFSLRDQNAGRQDGQNQQRPAARPADPGPAGRVEDVSQNFSRLSLRTGGLDIRI